MKDTIAAVKDKMNRHEVPRGSGTGAKCDDQAARWGRDRHEGFDVGKYPYVQRPPMFFTRDHHPLWLGDQFKGRSAFLICGGPSFGKLDHSLLASPGLLTMGINNSVKSFRPNLWTSVDSPDHFMKSIWLDPAIMKFVPICHAGKAIFDNDAWKFLPMNVGDCPNIVHYKRNEHFQPNQYLWEDTVNWGNHKKHGGGRSIMLGATKILFQLGVRRVFLLGCDFTMNADVKYHFDQDRHSGSIKGNSDTYKKLNDRYTVLRPIFEKEGYEIFNCNPNSGLTAFDHVPHDKAIQMALDEFGVADVNSERTNGLYDVETQYKKKGCQSRDEQEAMKKQENGK